MGTPYDDIHWSAVLKSVSGFEMYRKKYGRISPARHRRISGDGPRISRAPFTSAFSRADESLHAITGTPWDRFTYPSERLMGLLRAELDFTPVDADHRAAVCTNIWMAFR